MASGEMDNRIFCERCGKPLKFKSFPDVGLVVGICSCGFQREIDSSIAISDSLYNLNSNRKGTGIVDLAKESKGGFPHVCPNCGHDKADVYDLGANYSDESNIYLFKCKKCGHVERQSDGSGN